VRRFALYPPTDPPTRAAAISAQFAPKHKLVASFQELALPYPAFHPYRDSTPPTWRPSMTRERPRVAMLMRSCTMLSVPCR
jgi:hypothetical protein